jgi:hypothetical protein
MVHSVWRRSIRSSSSAEAEDAAAARDARVPHARWSEAPAYVRVETTPVMTGARVRLYADSPAS